MSSSNTHWFGGLALLAVLVFIALVTLQVLEFMYYDADPSIWPLQ